ncbi:hypothetical protein AAG906_018299 [Vitis piasezkii]
MPFPPHPEPPTGETVEPLFPQHHFMSLRRIGSSRWGCNYGDACFPNRALKWYMVCKKWTSGTAVLFASLHFACFSSLLLFACARVST